MSGIGRYGENTKLDHIPGDDGMPVLGHTFEWLSNVYDFGIRMRATYGEVYRTRAVFLRYVAFASADGAGLILRDAEHNFSSKLGWEPFMGRLFPNSLPVMDFAEQRANRQQLSTLFRPAAMAGYGQLIGDIVRSTVPRWGERDIIRTYPTLKSLTLDIAARAFVGLDLQSEIDFINKHFVTVNKGLAPIVPYPVPGLGLWRAMQSRARLQQHFTPAIAERRKSQGKDILSQLCRATDESGASLSDQAIFDHLIQILAAGHDTATSSLTLSLYYLARYPEWQDRLRERSLSVNPDGISYEQLPELVEHDWFFRETLRMWPLVPQVFRRAIRAFDFQGHHIPANTQVVIDAGYIQRSPEYWSAPQTFDPERFSEGRAEHTRHKYQWIPFGGGSHVCIGQQFAMMEAKIILHELLTRYRFELVDSELKMNILPVTYPKDGLRLRLTPLPRRTTRPAHSAVPAAGRHVDAGKCPVAHAE